MVHTNWLTMKSWGKLHLEQVLIGGYFVRILGKGTKNNFIKFLFK